MQFNPEFLCSAGIVHVEDDVRRVKGHQAPGKTYEVDLTWSLSLFGLPWPAASMRRLPALPWTAILSRF